LDLLLGFVSDFELRISNFDSSETGVRRQPK
jgi:hypothetical protein